MAPSVRFCPRCGLSDVRRAALDTEPLEVTVGRRTYRVLDRIAVGSVCSVYRCRFTDDRAGAEVEGVFKIARDPRTNHLVANEAAILRRLHGQDASGRYTPFLPAVEESLGLADDAPHPTCGPRQANVSRMHGEIRSPDELYTLEEVRAHFPGGLDPRHVAWIWRRVLSILGFAHLHGVVHAAVLPMHVLIEPRGHKLLLIDWCCAAHEPWNRPDPVTVLGWAYLAWYKREGALRKPPTPALDVALAARSMIDLLGGDAARAEFPAAIDPALQRYFTRCLAGGSGARADAWKLLDDFDRLIAALWGPRTYCRLDLPPKRPG